MSWRRLPAIKCWSRWPTNTRRILLNTTTSSGPSEGCCWSTWDLENRELPAPEGTTVNPGHAIESMWFVLHLARRRKDRGMVETAADLIRRHLEAGWDAGIWSISWG